MEIKGQLPGVVSFLPLCGSQGLNSCHQAVQQKPLLTHRAIPLAPKTIFFTHTQKTPVITRIEQPIVSTRMLAPILETISKS